MAEKRKAPVDNSAHYKHTEYVMRDRLYNWIVRRYGKKGNKWEKSDEFVFGKFIYSLWDWIPTIAFIWFVYFISNFAYTHYGPFKGMLVVAVMLLVRFNSLIRKIDQMIRLMKGE